jgi:hypothetical protein
MKIMQVHCVHNSSIISCVLHIGLALWLDKSCSLSLQLRGCLVPSHILPSQSVDSHKSVAATKSVAKKLEAKLWQELARKLTL